MLDLIQKAHVKLKTFKRDEDGAAIVEYGVALLIVTAIGVGVAAAIGTEVAGLFDAALCRLDPTADGC